MKTSWRQILIKSFFPVFAAVMLVAGFAYAVWTGPTVAPPGGNVEAPINTGATTQTKQGGDICVNIGGATKCLSTGGGDLSNVRVGPPGCNNILTFSLTCNTDMCSLSCSGGHCYYCGPVSWGCSATYRTCGGSCSAGSSMSCSTASVGASFLSGANHSTDSCTVAGGEVMQDGSDSFCKFNSSSCPSGWTRFKNWSATTAKTCTGTTNDNTNCPVSSCPASSHTFTNIVPESCSYKLSRSWTPNSCCSSWSDVCTSWYSYCWEGGCYGADCFAAGCTEYCASYGSVCNGWYDCSYCSDSPATCYASITAVGCY